MYSFRLTEEIARWAFEVICMNNTNWYIAFTNPTAGPWKTIKCLNKNRQEGEVFRFELEETRPDILLVNDAMKIIIIIEAKDSLEKLLSGSQPQKSVEVVVNLTDILKEKEKNQFWGERAHYKVITGLLWGAENETTWEERESLFETYISKIPSNSGVCRDFIVGIETSRISDGLQCKICGKDYHKKWGSLSLPQIAKSFGLEIL